MFEAVIRNNISVDMPISDRSFQFQAELESPVFSGVLLSVYIKHIDGENYIENPSPESQTRILHWSKFDVVENREKGDVINLLFNPNELYNTAVINNLVKSDKENILFEFDGELVIYDPDSETRLEAIQPIRINLIKILKR